MRNIWILIIVAFIGVSCSNDIENTLEGRWLLKQVEENGVTHQVDTVFYNFQNTLFSYQVYISEYDTFVQCYGFKFMDSQDQVRLDLSGYPDKAETFRATYTDWPEINRTFIIEKATGSNLILKDHGKRYLFDKH